jgi:hypothetical protein
MGKALIASLFLLSVLSCERGLPVSPAETPAFAPAANGNKLVFTLNAPPAPVTCPNGEVLTRTAEGWVQVRLFERGKSRNVELDVFHSVIRFESTSGETYLFRDVGPDHYYIDRNGDLIVAITGRSTGSGVIGHVVINLETGETLLVAGQAFGTAAALACEALT